MESDQIKCEQSKFILFSSVPCTLDSVGFHENVLNAIDSRQQEAVCSRQLRNEAADFLVAAAIECYCSASQAAAAVVGCVCCAAASR